MRVTVPNLRSIAMRNGGTFPADAVAAYIDGRESPAARFGATTDRLWRMELEAGSQGAVPMLQLGYRPALLRFLAQGSMPYTLAFGSRRAEGLAPASCDSLLRDVDRQDLAAMIVPGYAVSAVTSLRPSPNP